MLSAICTMGAIGLLSGLILAFASKIFYVYVDPQILAVEDALPGANCGGCGLPGCSANAEAIVAGKAEPNSCVAGSAELGEIIAEILGVTVEAKEPDIALPDCTYGTQDADIKYTYDGINDCRAAILLGGGMKVCNIGCLGFGTCAKACPFGAITMGEDNLPVVDKELCTGCGTCERVCPKNIIKLSSVTRRILKEYTTEDCTTPCQRACPAGIDIREYVKQISLGEYHRAVQVIKERVPFPTVIGRICPRPCENDCRRKYVDEPVAINALKRFVADFENHTDKRIVPFKAPETGRKIAVVGGGVEGLSTAFFSARLGHSPTVFEATPQLGGLLRSAIARNRLPLSILDWDIKGILETGVTADTGKKIGRDFTIDSLLEDDFEAVFLASGGWDNRMSRDSGYKLDKTLSGVYLLIDLLNSTPENHNSLSCGAHAVIVGGENLAAAAVNKCKEAGAEKITIISREKENSSSFGEEDLSAVKKEGHDILYNSAVTRFLGKGPDLLWLEYTDLLTGSKTVMPANTLFLASGRFPELIFHTPEPKEGNDYEDSPEEAVTWEAITPYKQSAFSKETGILSDGDPLTDISAAVKAIGAGRRGAASIHYIMYEMGLNGSENVVTPLSVIQNVSSLEDVMSSPRSIMPLGTINDEELEQGFKETTARKEAGRCLRCGLICYRKKV